MPGSSGSFFSARWRMVKCEVSMPPSSACSQLRRLHHLADGAMRLGRLHPVEPGQRGLPALGAHIGPDDAALLVGGIGLHLDLVAELARLVHLLDALAGDVVFPAVIDAAQPVLLVAAEPQRRAAMRAELVDHADLAVGGAEGDEVLAQEPHADRRAIRLRQLPRQQRRNPIAAHGLAHRRPGADPGQTLVLFARQHGLPPSSAERPRSICRTGR